MFSNYFCNDLIDINHSRKIKNKQFARPTEDTDMADASLEGVADPWATVDGDDNSRLDILLQIADGSTSFLHL